MTNVLRARVDHPSAWTGAEMQATRAWEYRLEAGERAELEAALAAVKARGLPLAAVTAADFPLPSLAPRLARLRDGLRTERGFALMRNFPVEGYGSDDLDVMYWGMCQHIGTGLSQNGEGGLIHYVTDGAKRPRQGSRGVGLPRVSSLHVDLMDVVTLLCVQQAPDDPPSWLASSVTVHNEMLARAPEAMERLYQGFEWSRMGEHGPGEGITSGYRVPVFSHSGGQISCRYNRSWIRNAYERKGEEMSAEDSAILDILDEVAYENRFEFPFHAGDVQFCSNYTVLHGRPAHAPVADEARKRMLLRIWLDIEDMRAFSDVAVIRFGIGRHGQLGWTAAELLAGVNRVPRARREDGAVAL